LRSQSVSAMAILRQLTRIGRPMPTMAVARKTRRGARRFCVGETKKFMA
jgi:hypothetical protein